MAFDELTSATKEILGGSCALVVCLALYLAWWTITFNPNGSATRFGAGCIIIATLFGFVGVVLMIIGLTERSIGKGTLSGWMLLGGGIVAYLVLFLITSIGLKRQVTTELALIVAWAVLIVAFVNSFFATGDFSFGLSVGLIVAMAIIAVGSIVCYLLYYQLEPVPSWIDGMIPLIATGLFQMTLTGAVVSAL